MKRWVPWLAGVGALCAAGACYVFTSGGSPLLLASGPGAAGAIPPAAVTRHDVTAVLGAALAFEVDPGLPTAAQAPVGGALSSSSQAELLQAAEARARAIYAPTSAQLSTAIWGVQNLVSGWPTARVLAGGVEGLKLGAMSVQGGSAEATWSATLWSVTTARNATGVWTKPYRQVSAATGTASFVYKQGEWLVSAWNITYTPGGGGP